MNPYATAPATQQSNRIPIQHSYTSTTGESNQPTHFRQAVPPPSSSQTSTPAATRPANSQGLSPYDPPLAYLLNDNHTLRLQLKDLQSRVPFQQSLTPQFIDQQIEAKLKPVWEAIHQSNSEPPRLIVPSFPPSPTESMRSGSYMSTAAMSDSNFSLRNPPNAQFNPHLAQSSSASGFVTPNPAAAAAAAQAANPWGRAGQLQGEFLETAAWKPNSFDDGFLQFWKQKLDAIEAQFSELFTLDSSDGFVQFMSTLRAQRVAKRNECEKFVADRKREIEVQQQQIQADIDALERKKQQLSTGGMLNQYAVNNPYPPIAPSSSSSSISSPPTVKGEFSQPQPSSQYLPYQGSAGPVHSIKQESFPSMPQQPHYNPYQAAPASSSSSMPVKRDPYAAITGDPFLIFHQCGFLPFDFEYRTSAANHIKSLLRDKMKVSAASLANDVWHYESRYNISGAQEWRAQVAFENFRGEQSAWNTLKTAATEESAKSALRRVQRDDNLKWLFLRQLPTADDPNPISAVRNYLRDRSIYKDRLLEERMSTLLGQYVCELHFGNEMLASGVGSDKVVAKTNASIECLKRLDAAVAAMKSLSFAELVKYDASHPNVINLPRD